MPIPTMTNAQNSKNDEFYTQYEDIEKEIMSYLDFDSNLFEGKTVLLPCDDPEWSNFTKFFAQNFERFKLKKLISTSYAPDSKKFKSNYQPTLFEINDPQFDENKTITNGKIFTLTRDKSGDGKIDVNDLEWKYLEGDGDFKSDEIKNLRDEADIIITNPPFSLFREFLSWIYEADKKFVIIGNMNSITYREVFPLIKNNEIWLGAGKTMVEMFGMKFLKIMIAFIKKKTEKYAFVAGTIWFTNIDHGRRHQPLPLMTESDIVKFVTKTPFEKYENYDAIEIPKVKQIPSDYNGIMGVPISFLSKHSPEQFEIIWQASGNTRASAPKEILERLTYLPHQKDKGGGAVLNGKMKFGRILIKHKKLNK